MLVSLVADKEGGDKPISPYTPDGQVSGQPVKHQFLSEAQRKELQHQTPQGPPQNQENVQLQVIEDVEHNDYLSKSQRQELQETAGKNGYDNVNHNDEDDENGKYLSAAQREEIKKTPGNDLIVGLDDDQEVYMSDDDVIGDDMQTAGYIGAPLSPQSNAFNQQQIEEDNQNLMAGMESPDDDIYDEYHANDNDINDNGVTIGAQVSPDDDIYDEYHANDNDMDDNMVTIGAPLSPQENDEDEEYEYYEEEYYEDDM